MSVDLVVTGKRLHRVGGETLAVKNGRIVAIGSRSDARGWMSARTRVLDFGDATILPGLTDAHSHPVLGATVSRGVDLRKVATLDGLRAALAEHLVTLQPGDWLLGWGLDHNVWGGGEPRAADLDAVTGSAPTLLRMFDAHSAVANTAATERAGITSGIEFPSGSRVVAHQGKPTGFLLEMEAIALVAGAIPAEDRDALRVRLRSSLREMAASGLTGAHVMDFEDSPADLYHALDDADELALRLRIFPFVLPEHSPADWRRHADSVGSGGRLWRIHGAKMMLDGTIDNGTAWLSSPDTSGMSLRSNWSDLQRYHDAIEYFASREIVTATHAIGDAAVAHAARVISDIRSKAPGTPHRIEHLELTSDEIVTLVASSGAVASMQPTHCTHFVTASGADNWSQRLGPDRARHAWRVRSLAEAGVAIALGSDWPIDAFEPLPIIAESQLRHRIGEPSSSAVVATEGIDAARAIDGYTIGAAIAAGTEQDEGTLRVGALADLTVLSGDVYALEPEAFAEAAVLATVVDGRLVHS